MEPSVEPTKEPPHYSYLEGIIEQVTGILTVNGFPSPNVLNLSTIHPNSTGSGLL